MSLLLEPSPGNSSLLAPQALPTFPSSWGGGSRSLGPIWFFFPQLLPLSPCPPPPPLAEMWPPGPGAAREGSVRDSMEDGGWVGGLTRVKAVSRLCTGPGAGSLGRVDG